MAWAPDYCTSSELKSAQQNTTSSSDAEISVAITAASRVIDQWCGRQFGVLSTAAPRYYKASWDEVMCQYVIWIDDLQTTTNLVVKTNDERDGSYSNTLVLDTDFSLYPRNAVADGRPWTMIGGLRNSDYRLPVWQDGIEVTAKWGWTAVPTVVKQACLILANRYVKRKGAAFGVVGAPQAGTEVRMLTPQDADVITLLSSVVRYGESF
jgi:hypothetical protein